MNIAVRPESLSKTLVKNFESKGAIVKTIDVEKATASDLASIFEGIDTVISCLLVLPFTKQSVVVDACKLAGVKRFLPSEWATAAKRGIIPIKDEVIMSPCIRETRRKLNPLAETRASGVQQGSRSPIYECRRCMVVCAKSTP